ncbi:50S ribosomal protein L11 methyltransferase [Parvularcula sp. LCG005]|uniref:50S ribosomal protein L11 methyltransferase n=1 Tax=Parvularcula sp. LCG005 TaxID=3078805 RepID=UPI002942F0B6|nr:50S ribosomal protein L11 methyltransferase [Parvularcula sp. LCG005]WOI54656.1 50S ribosomal protein L11 methyltransferase [Parvularcula sp. LCG005]
MSTLKLIWQGPQADLERLDVLLSEVLFPPSDAVTLLKDDSSASDADAAWSLHAYFTDRPDQQELDSILTDYGLGHLDAATVEDLPDQDWVAHALEGLGVVQSGLFVLYGSHDAAKADALPGLKVQIEANRAFGTGHHPTTAGCLDALSRLEKFNPESVLDVGTGSGVLAIAARRLWADAGIIGTDIDAPSVTIAAENAATNGVDDITFIEADGLGSVTENGRRFPLILANILAEPLMMLAPQIADALARDGRVVLAGLLDRQAEGVLDAYRQVGLVEYDRVSDATWPVLLLRRDDA